MMEKLNESSGGYFLDHEAWSRRAQFAFFKEYELPFFGLCADVKVTATRRWCRENEQSFSLACWFLCQQSVNTVDEFRYRLRGERVWVHERIGVATTIANADESFRFCHLPYAAAFELFSKQARDVMARPAPEDLDDRAEDDALIHGSTVPWLRFSAVAHPRRLCPQDSVPKIVFGRAVEEGDEVVMPVAVDVHHGLMDGRHASRFYAAFEDALARPELTLAPGPR